MNYSQKPLIELFKAGKFPGETSIPKHIETVISNVFLFDKKVYKFYKNDNDFFNKGFRDISEKANRFAFTEKDFRWNNALSSSIYIRLANIAVKDDAIIETSSAAKADELVIVMNKVDTHDMLYEKLVMGKISEEDCFAIGKQLAESLKKVQTKPPQVYNFYDLFESRINDLRDWIRSASDKISIEESDSYCDYLEQFKNENKEWFETELSTEVTTDGDFHGHNAIYSNGVFYLMDTYPPKEAWGIGHKLFPLYRIGTDIWALSGKQEFFETFIKGYEDGSGIKIDRRLDNLYIIYASAIMVSYLYMLQRTDPNKKESAEQFHKFIRDYFASIKTGLRR